MSDERKSADEFQAAYEERERVALEKLPFLASVALELANGVSIQPGRITYVSKTPGMAPINEPEIPVTEETWPDPPSALLTDPTFNAIWRAIKTWDINVPAAYGGYCGATGNHVFAIYRAMAAVAPKHDIASAMIIKSLQDRIEELQSYSHALAIKLDERHAAEQGTKAYQYLHGVFELCAPQCLALPDMLGLCTQIDNLIAGYRSSIAALEAEAAVKDAQINGQTDMLTLLDTKLTHYMGLYRMLEHDIRMLKADKVSDHNYEGPVKDGKAVPDESHERFHGSIGDVLSGNIIRPARDQMEKALADAKAKDASAPRSLPGTIRSDDPRRIGG